MSDVDRVAFWRIIIERSNELVTDLKDFIAKQDLSRIKPISLLQK